MAIRPEPVSVPLPSSPEEAATRVLLVSADPKWLAAVRETTAARGGIVETVSADQAVARLAIGGTHYSHVLLDPDRAGGLLDALIDLTSGLAGTEILMLLLGSNAAARAGLGVIPRPGRRSIAAALGRQQVPARYDEPNLRLAELREAVDGAMIETRYQPIVRIADRAPASMEVLARLNHPRHGPLMPDWFVPRFEEAGLGYDLTDRVSTLAFADLAGPSLSEIGLTIALNYPLDVLSHPDAAMQLDDKRRAAGIPLERVEIELTESRPVEDFLTLGRSLEHLRRLGYRIAIDDVGPGVQNLDTLLTMPFTALKLDKSVVGWLETAGSAARYARDVIAKAQAHGLTVIAEGVEAQSTWDLLRELGVELAQGYFVARPLHPAAVPIWLNAWRAMASPA